MSNPIRAVIAALAVLALAFVLRPDPTRSGHRAVRTLKPSQSLTQPEYGLSGSEPAITAELTKRAGDFYAHATTVLAAQRAADVRTVRSSAPLGGPCAASKPAGFPDYIIQRESGGDPNAVNRSSGAAGCAQIMPFWFAEGGGCHGLSYDECWSRMWNGGKGASNWACTVESGCRG